MKYTKILAVLLALVMVFALCACKNDEEPAETTTKDDVVTTIADSEEDTTTEADSEEDTTTEFDSEEETTTEADSEEETTTEADSEEETTTEEGTETTGGENPEQFIIDLYGVFPDPTFDGGTCMFEQVNAGTVNVANGQMTISNASSAYMQTWAYQTALTPGVYNIYFKANITSGSVNWAQFCMGPGNTCQAALNAGQFNGTEQMITITHSNSGGNSMSFGCGGSPDLEVVFDYIQIVPAE